MKTVESAGHERRGAWTSVLLFGLGALLLGCEDSGVKSAGEAKKHVAFLSAAAEEDVREVRAGVPEGARLLGDLFREAHPEPPSAENARKALNRVRDQVPDLRVAKGTFFAVVDREGRVVRNDRDQDLMAGKDIFQFYPELREALKKDYLETRGSMPEATGVRGRPDSQWVAASPVREGEDSRGLYVTGWSWSAYAYRLETSIRSQVLSETEEGGKVPLLYVYVIVGDDVYGAPIAPTVNAEAIGALKPLEQLQGTEIWTQALEIERRKFGVAVQAVKALGDRVAIAVLRSET